MRTRSLGYVIRSVICLSAITMGWAGAGHAAVLPIAEAAQLFGVRENVKTMDMSPSGDKVVMLISDKGPATGVVIADLATGDLKPLTRSSGLGEKLHWCEFASETKLICSFGGTASVEGSMVDYSRLITMNTDGTGLKPLGQRQSDRDAGLRQFDGSIVDWLPGEQDSVLMAREYVPETNTTGTLLNRTKSGLGVDRINLTNLRVTGVEAPMDGVVGYISDGQGKVRIRQLAGENYGLLTGASKFEYRLATSRGWQPLASVTANGPSFDPIAVDATTDSAYVLKEKDGRAALYRVKLDGTLGETLVGADKEVDIDGVVRIGHGQRVVGYTYASDQRRTVYFDRDYAALQTALGKAIPGQPLIDFLAASADGQKLLILASGDTQPGTFYRFDRATKHLEQVAWVRPDLGKTTLATVRSIRVPASDGASIPAYLTIPAGSDGKNLPAVVLPHGGPSARDEWGFDWLSQFLASRGYAVIQPNYRGSAGYGDQWMAQNGFRGWQTSIGDVTAAEKYLVSQGIADPARVAIVGWSYGGYAALQSAATEPSLYKAVVAIAPVTDLSLFKAQFNDFTNKRLVDNMVGGGDVARAGSPLRNVAAIKAPVLLVHADMDSNVAITNSDQMSDALRSAGKPVEYFRVKGLDHQLDDSNVRTEMLTRIAALLDRTIGH